MNFTILKFDTLDSTNNEAINEAKRGAEEGLCVVARRQTAGRGRHGRVWSSPKDAGLYFSIVLRPKVNVRFLPLVTLLAAIAVHDTLEELYRIDCDIKWVNDIHVNGKKICGILAETAETVKGLAVIVGIGINLNSSSFSPEISTLATSLEAETNREINSEILLHGLTKSLSENYKLFQTPNGVESIRQKWLLRSSYAFGKSVRAALSDRTICGVTQGIAEDGALIVKTDEGKIEIIRAGEVEQLRKKQF